MHVASGLKLHEVTVPFSLSLLDDLRRVGAIIAIACASVQHAEVPSSSS